MKRLVLALSLTSLNVRAEPAWLTVQGDAGDASTDTVQVDAKSAVAFDQARLVNIRVNRSSSRTGYDGKPFRSYNSSVVIDCSKLTARHRTMDLFDGPFWTGKSRSFRYEDELKTMEFRDMVPNPKDRIVKAACTTDLIRSN